MKNILFGLSILALTSCRYEAGGNKGILPAPEDKMAVHQAEAQGHASADDFNEHTAETMHAGEDSGNMPDDDHSDNLLDASGNYLYNTGEEVELSLPTKKALRVGNQSTEYKLNQQLSDDNFKVNTDETQNWISLDGITFNTGSDELTSASKRQVQNLADLLDAYPNASIQLGGYTDNQGSAAINQPLSEGRAKAVKQALADAGIDENRMRAKGYGQEHPVCEANDTPACRAQNRRVDVRLVKK